MSQNLSGDICYLCKNIEGKSNPSIIFHRFPTQPEARQKWMNILNIDPTIDDPNKIVLCSEHFKNENYCHTANGGKKRLKSGIVPSIRLNTFTERINENESSSENLIIPKIEPCESYESSNEIDEHDASIIPKEESDTFDSIMERIAPIEPSYSTLYYEPKSEQMENDPNIPLAIETSPINIKTELEIEEPKISVHAKQPRYLGDISELSFSTPTKCRMTIDLINKLMDKQKKKVKSLQQKNRRLIANFKSLEDMVKEMKDRELISDSAFNRITAHIDKITKNSDV